LEDMTMTTLHAGQRITLLKIDDMMALTHRYELQVATLVDPVELVGYHKARRVAVVKQRGKRKPQYLDLRGDEILLDGWDVPFKADTEGASVFSGNACFNLVGDAEAIRACLESRAVFPISDDAKAKVFVWPANRSTCGDEGVIILWPEIDTHHAVVNRVKAESEARRTSELAPAAKPLGWECVEA
jgi:hypothetical protein